MKLRLVFC